MRQVKMVTVFKNFDSEKVFAPDFWTLMHFVALVKSLIIVALIFFSPWVQFLIMPLKQLSACSISSQYLLVVSISKTAFAVSTFSLPIKDVAKGLLHFSTSLIFSFMHWIFAGNFPSPCSMQKSFINFLAISKNGDISRPKHFPIVFSAGITHWMISWCLGHKISRILNPFVSSISWIPDELQQSPTFVATN